MVDLRLRPDKCTRCRTGVPFLIHRRNGKEEWLCRECVDALVTHAENAADGENLPKDYEHG